MNDNKERKQDCEWEQDYAPSEHVRSRAYTSEREEKEESR